MNASCFENFLIWTLVIGTILYESGFNGLVLAALAVGLIAMCALPRNRAAQNPLTNTARSDSLE